MSRRYYRRTPRSNRDKYSVEQTFIKTGQSQTWTQVPAVEGSTVNTYQYSISVIPPTETQGMRKVKHFTLTFAPANDMAYALVYVPEGYDPNVINYPVDGMAISMYEPNQFVISQGILDSQSGQLRIRSPLSRNLNSGDSIYLILATPAQNNNTTCTVKYAITLQ